MRKAVEEPLEHTVDVLGWTSGLCPALVKLGEEYLHFEGKLSVAVGKANLKLRQHSLACVVLKIACASDELIVMQPHELSA